MSATEVMNPVAEAYRCPARGGPGRWQWIGMGLVALAIAAAFVFLPMATWLRSAVEWTAELGWIGMLLFIALYAVAATLAVPVTPLNIGAGVLFGWWLGFLLALAGGVAAAMLSFMLARFLLQAWIRRRIACYPTSHAILEDIHENPWRAIITLRLHPVIPASVKNYMFGVRDVRLDVYAAATAIAYTPVVFLYAYFGAAGYMTIEQETQWTPTLYVLYGLGLVGALALTGVLTWYGKRRIDEIKDKQAQRHQTAA